MSKKTLIIIVAVAIIVLALIGGGFFMLWQKLSVLGQPQPAEGLNAAAKSEQSGIGPIFPLEAFIVNLSDQGGKRYLRTTISLELADQKTADELTKRLPQIRDGILTILPTKKVDDLQSVEGKNALRTEISTQLNAMVGKDSVKKIFFTEFVIQ